MINAEGRVKVLDFGLAQHFREGELEETLATQTELSSAILREPPKELPAGFPPGLAAVGFVLTCCPVWFADSRAFGPQGSVVAT